MVLDGGVSNDVYICVPFGKLIKITQVVLGWTDVYSQYCFGTLSLMELYTDYAIYSYYGRSNFDPFQLA